MFDVHRSALCAEHYAEFAMQVALRETCFIFPTFRQGAGRYRRQSQFFASENRLEAWAN